MSDVKYVTTNSYILNKSEEMICDRLNCNAVPLVITLLNLESDCLAFFKVLLSGSIEVSLGRSGQLLYRTHKLMILVLSGWHLMLEKLLKKKKKKPEKPEHEFLSNFVLMRDNSCLLIGWVLVKNKRNCSLL